MFADDCSVAKDPLLWVPAVPALAILRSELDVDDSVMVNSPRYMVLLARSIRAVPLTVMLWMSRSKPCHIPDTWPDWTLLPSPTLPENV